MITPSASIRIAAPPATLIGFIADPTNAPRWMKALAVAELITPGPIARGSRFREVMSAGGKRVEAVCEIVELDPERRYAWQSVGGGATAYGGGFTAIPVERGTELRYDGWATHLRRAGRSTAGLGPPGAARGGGGVGGDQGSHRAGSLSRPLTLERPEAARNTGADPQAGGQAAHPGRESTPTR